MAGGSAQSQLRPGGTRHIVRNYECNTPVNKEFNFLSFVKVFVICVLRGGFASD